MNENFVLSVLMVLHYQGSYYEIICQKIKKQIR